MRDLVFKAYVVTNEINLNKIAIKCNIKKKYTWEEPLILQGNILGNILQMHARENQKVLVFSFGSIVFVNLEERYVLSFIHYVKGFEPDIDINNWNQYTEEYELHIDKGATAEFSNEYVTVPEYEEYYTELIPVIIAKSVALEKTEEMLGKLLDRLEGMIVRLERGNLKIGDKELARTTAGVMKHEYNTIAYIMILDKPDITWSNNDAAHFYDMMTEVFELNDRYEILKRKTEILNNIISGFTSIRNATRGSFLEWIVIILIVMEIVLMIMGLIR